MCVDDYEFRHYSSIREKICRRFVFINQDDDQRIFLVNISQFQQNGMIPLCKILQHLSKKGLNIEDYNYYLPKFQTQINPSKQCQVSLQYLEDKELVFKMVKKDQNCQYKYEKKEEESQQSENHHKRMKQAERGIGEVIEYVKKWRMLHQIKHISLGQSAKLVGISKKSLDDYFLVLRIGQLCNFDYKNNLYGKMGDLRAYIRTQESKTEGRLPKQLKYFKLFEYVNDPDLSSTMEIEESNSNLVCHH